MIDTQIRKYSNTELDGDVEKKQSKRDGKTPFTFHMKDEFHQILKEFCFNEKEFDIGQILNLSVFLWLKKNRKKVECSIYNPDLKLMLKETLDGGTRIDTTRKTG